MTATSIVYDYSSGQEVVTLYQRVAKLGLVPMRDPCRAALWDIVPGQTCPVCGAEPDTKCGRVKQ